LNFIEAVVAIVKELMLSYLDLISCIIHKLLEEALFHNQVISQALISYFAKKIQQVFHNFSIALFQLSCSIASSFIIFN